MNLMTPSLLVAIEFKLNGRRELETMTEFNQAKFESDAKKMVAEYLNYKVDEKEVSIVWFSKVGANAKAMICDMDDHCFEVTYFGEDGEYIIDVYSYVECDKSDEEEL